MKVTFLGATETVTGSRYLVESGGRRLLVDCGLYQGLKALRLRNWAKFPIDPASQESVVLTHAHIDHSGYIPLLARNGFRGPIYTSEGTVDLCQILLPDSGHLQEEEARYANKRKYSKHRPALPLYTEADARHALELFKPISFDESIDLGDSLQLRLSHAGHILGAACVHLSERSSKIVFSGDVGRPVDPIMKPPAPLGDVDYLVLESTYGNRRHSRTDPTSELEEVINRTIARGGIIIVPAFAVGRAQAVLHLISSLKEAKRIPDVPIYLNSPMSINATQLFCRHAEEHRLSEAQCRAMCDNVHYVHTADESKALNRKREPMIIISASGMATGGRVLHHLKEFAPDPRNTILFTGFQAAGTRGEAMVHGADEIKIHGQYVRVEAEVLNLDSLSAHADYTEMIEWLSSVPSPPKRVFLVHGEPAAQDSLRRYIQDRLKWRVDIAHYMEEVELA